jgi:hypothetical protein
MVVNSSTNPYQTCHKLGTDDSLTKQYNSTSNIVSCCTAQDIGVTTLAKTQDNSTPVTNIYTFLVTLTHSVASNNCDYTKFISSESNAGFFSNNYPSLYANAMIQKNLYNILYTGDATYNASSLVPTFDGKTVTCPANYVPYMAEVMLPNSDNIDYAHFCSKDSESVITSKLNGLKVNYNLSNFESNDGSKCKSNTCNTVVNAHLGQATHPEYVSQKEPNTISGGAIIGFSILGFILIGVLIWALVASVKYKTTERKLKATEARLRGANKRLS